jgi:hypothetical protein
MSQFLEIAERNAILVIITADATGDQSLGEISRLPPPLPYPHAAIMIPL